MNILTLFLLPLIVVLLLALPLLPIVKKTAKTKIFLNLGTFVAVCLLFVICPISGVVLAENSATEVATDAGLAEGLKYIAAALVTGMSCIGAGIAVAAAAPAAIGAVSEDEKIFSKAMIFVVLGEGVAIYGLLISILILQ